MVKMIMTAVDEGREDDLKDAGLKVTKRTAKEVMDSNLSNEEIVNKVLGPMTDAEEVELMRQLQHTQNKIQEDDSGKGFEGAVAGIDPAFLARIYAISENGWKTASREVATRLPRCSRRRPQAPHWNRTPAGTGAETCPSPRRGGSPIGGRKAQLCLASSRPPGT